jgi:heme/copper-type cytochrome/quinol oxidase subunit 1
VFDKVAPGTQHDTEHGFSRWRRLQAVWCVVDTLGLGGGWRVGEMLTWQVTGRVIGAGETQLLLRKGVAWLTKVSTWYSGHLIPGWAFVTPYSARLRYSALGKVDIALIVVFSVSLGSVLSAVNYVCTYRCVGAAGLGGRREVRSFFVDALLVGSRMMILANPALLVGIILLLSDRHLGTTVFDFSGGGDTVLFQHLFWFFGHPEVYIIIIPCFGFVNSLLPHYLSKRLSGRLSLQYSMYTIAFMSYAV